MFIHNAVISVTHWYLSILFRQIKTEMDQCKDELLDMEQELVHLRRDSHSKAVQLGHLEMVLDQKHSELRKKTLQGSPINFNIACSADVSSRSCYLALSNYYKNKNTYKIKSAVIQQLPDVYDSMYAWNLPDIFHGDNCFALKLLTSVCV